MISSQKQVQGQENSSSTSQDDNNNNEKEANTQLRELDSSYKIISNIGSGTYGIVYKARVVNTSNYVAIKKFRIPTNSEGVSTSVLREVSLVKHLSKFKHPNIVGFLDVCSVSPEHVREGREFMLYMIFEYLDQDLHTFIETATLEEINIVKIKSILYQIFKGMDFLHGQRILHRDLKPQNLLITSEGQVKIADFGLSKVYDYSWKLSNGVVTLWYRAPEILLGASYGSPVDIWAIGAIFAGLYKTFALFQGWSEREQLLNTFRVIGTPKDSDWPSDSKLVPGCFPRFPARSFRTVVPGLCSSAEDLLNKLLTFKPNERITAKDALKHPYFESHIFKQPLSQGEIEASISRNKYLHDYYNRNPQTRKRKLEMDNSKATATVTTAAQESSSTAVPAKKPNDSDLSAKPPKTNIG